MSPNIGVLIAARTVQGFGAAVLVPCSLALLNHAYPEDRERTHAIGIWAAGASVALAAGPVVGGVLIATIGRRSIFFLTFLWGCWAFGSPCAMSRRQRKHTEAWITWDSSSGSLHWP
jgi:MFS transporter, DHA2 family, methylenomycin A resistance protein